MKFFDFFKNKKKEVIVNIYSPLNGRVIDLSEVPDEAFAMKLIGDGCAIEPSEGSIHAVSDACIDIFNTKHAVAFALDCGLELIVHFGIDTVELNGNGFEKLVDSGEVKLGDELVEYDLDYISNNAKTTKTPIVISNMDDVEELSIVASGKVSVGDLLMTVKLKK